MKEKRINRSPVRNELHESQNPLELPFRPGFASAEFFTTQYTEATGVRNVKDKKRP